MIEGSGSPALLFAFSGEQMSDKETIQEISRALDVLSRQADRAAGMWSEHPVIAKNLLDEVSRLTYGISGTLERLVGK